VPVREREEIQKMLRPAWSLTLAPHVKTNTALRQTSGSTPIMYSRQTYGSNLHSRPFYGFNRPTTPSHLH
jgi:hypothetical protein